MLALPSNPNDLTSWFAAPNSSPSSVAAEAYQNAIVIFETELSHDPKSHAWIRTNNSVEDVRQVVLQAQQVYDVKSSKTAKPRKWIDRFASSLMAYSSVLDCLSQADPLHAGLAWGAMKFVMLGVLSHSKMVGDLSKALAKIGEALPRIQLEGALYQSPWMRDAISKLYAYILLFLQNAVQWYSAGRLRRAMYTFSRPLLFGDIVIEINSCTAAIEAIANTSSRAELRALTAVSTSSHAGIQSLVTSLDDQKQRLKQSDLRLRAMQQTAEATNRRQEELFQLFLQYSANSQISTYCIAPGTGNSLPQIADAHWIDVSNILKPSLSPEDALSRCVISTRQSPWWQPDRDTAFLMRRLLSWGQLPSSSMLVVKAGARAGIRTKSMVIDVVTLLKSTSFPVFWSLSVPTQNQDQLTTTAILRSILFQALQPDPSVISRDHRLADIQTYKQEHTLTEWADLVAIVLSHIRNCFIVIEMETRHKSDIGSANPSQEAVDGFNRILDAVSSKGGVVKLLLVLTGNTTFKQHNGSTDGMVVARMNAPLPVARRSKQPKTSPFAGRQKFQPKLGTL